jgi:GTP-binding protein HflX
LPAHERPRGGEKAVLVHLDLQAERNREDLHEFEELVASAGVEAIEILTSSRHVPDSRLFVGKGKADEIRERVREGGAEVVLFNHELTPSQERNLERELECRVIDRTGLILDIFAQRARSFEGKLQVELAQLRHLSSRLVRGWTHLERQKGGIGLRGPGETQLETDRRLLGLRIKQINRRLNKVRKQREQGRQSRRRAEIPTVSLVGYTNAGKTTLFNRLTESDAFAADQLFATLDPTLRALEVDEHQRVILADTVGFIRHLPHDLVAAFRATLQETREASLLLHVVDAADDDRDAKLEAVQSVLEEIDAAEVPRLVVFNKIDLLEAEPRIDRDESGLPQRVWLSACSGAGLDLLRAALTERLMGQRVEGWMRLDPDEARLRAQLFELGAVVGERIGSDGGSLLELRLPRAIFERLVAREGLDPERLEPAERRPLVAGAA